MKFDAVLELRVRRADTGRTAFVDAPPDDPRPAAYVPLPMPDTPSCCCLRDRWPVNPRGTLNAVLISPSILPETAGAAAAVLLAPASLFSSEVEGPRSISSEVQFDLDTLDAELQPPLLDEETQRSTGAVPTALGAGSLGLPAVAGFQTCRPFVPEEQPSPLDESALAVLPSCWDTLDTAAALAPDPTLGDAGRRIDGAGTGGGDGGGCGSRMCIALPLRFSSFSSIDEDVDDDFPAEAEESRACLCADTAVFGRTTEPSCSPRRSLVDCCID